ncbi:unnamed protein product [Prorocentrum cordatum]|uniref:Uncharacterized protein n=1 Tax=Prorocentrum cordatum TaxID=2364126 RepID=A0ABN9UC12_9DINO|nr:unnamed protein product [Polarella glacialis]
MNCTDGLTEAPAPGPLACSRPSTVIRHESRRRLGQEPKSTAEPARRGRARRGSRRHPSSPSSPSHRDSEIPAPGGEEEEEEEERGRGKTRKERGQGGTGKQVMYSTTKCAQNRLGHRARLVCPPSIAWRT